MVLSFFLFCCNRLAVLFPLYLCFFFYYRIFRKTFFFMFRFFYKYFFDSFLFYEFQIVDCIYFFSFSYYFFNYYSFLDKNNLPLKIGWNSVGRNTMNLFEAKQRCLHFGFFSEVFLQIYSPSPFWVAPLYNGFVFFLDLFCFYFFFFVSSFLKNSYFHTYLSLVLFLDPDFFIYFYFFVLNTNNIHFVYRKIIPLCKCVFFGFFLWIYYFADLLFLFF
jgi:hypothetical protein